MLNAFIFSTLLALTFATLGIDVSEPVSSAAASCYKAAGYSFAIPRAWQSAGHFDPSLPGSVAALWGAGFEHVDIYLFPCASGRLSAVSQVGALKGNLTAKGVRYGMLWLDIEENPSSGCGWSANKSAACTFLGELISAAAGAGFSTGVCACGGTQAATSTASAAPHPHFTPPPPPKLPAADTSVHEWSTIFEAGCAAGQEKLPLWYPKTAAAKLWRLCSIWWVDKARH